MIKERTLKIGLIGVAVIVGVLGASAFQAGTDKFGVADISKIVEQSDLGKANQDQFKQLKEAREGVLVFIDQYRVLTNE